MSKLSVHQKKITKQAKSKNEPIKVVYISNPMKVKTSASEFRALVQELTGRDSDLTYRTDKAESSETTDNQTMKVANDYGFVQEEVVPAGLDPYRESSRSFGYPFEPFDDVFAPQMLENVTGFSYSSSLLYEFPQVDVLRSLDAV